MNISNYECFLVGRSRLSVALKNQIPHANYLDTDAINRLIRGKTYSLADNSIIFYTSAVTDPLSDKDLINQVNYLTPLALHKSISFKSKLVTFGTVLEKLYPDLNPYVSSKNNLNEYSNKSNNFLHFQLHTLYGIGQPKPHMFLGQIYDSIKNKTKFKMTSGTQFREYQNINIVTSEILNRMSHDHAERMITFGMQKRLKDLASNIFSYFNLDNLLEVTRDNNELDIYEETIFQKNTSLPHPNISDDICKYLEREL